ncbi:prepilin-type N-terminal cleavage/methylation domain-containing protein [Acinetobacter ursingii]|uniref:type IV pilin protein n=1 Tax=Acinetobacter ursingii TaxID=108980 RepID=UPI0021D0CBC0|nr:prepilin-type N-terminal cleavage/methylation domain-containing protein [Acinetobacter ursingii]MCU4413776.1 prepilin-type N-terminal cleavage/methylation domain-containing protein [Acinetobacter sp. WU_MDCI_Axc73]MDG9860863.1 prepilin-type N-terminal cleavage/methylation domain-containing protein [Acinetobacter ursingii]MDG9894544.1 prepilin-type N-terminal cleavage/methylation domain-containing protein [Acinetobacter ursingii]MDH0008029.1 prepilin-type N-terminal cleavage/methylation domai
MNYYKGFTLIELMVVVVIVAIFAAIAIPSYRSYVQKSTAAQVQQEMERINIQLEQYKSRNFNYRGFSVVSSGMAIPLNTSGASKTYTLYIRDASDPSLELTNSGVLGQGWILFAEANSKINYGSTCADCNSLQDKNYNFLMTSNGVKCKTRGKLIASETLTKINLSTTTPCGADSETW